MSPPRLQTQNLRDAQMGLLFLSFSF